MAVEAFITPSNVKQTIEKEVKEKPSIQDLTTIESPGKPVPVSLESISEEKIKRKKSQAKTDKTSIYSPIRDSTLIITEKPQAAEKIANALGSPKKISEQGVSYFELTRNSEKIIVSSAVGHLFNLTYKKGQRGWPIFEIEWIPSFLTKSAEFTKRYYNLLQKLSKRAKEFIIATDYDIEGEVIGWNILKFICKKENAKRMKFSTLTSKELENSFLNLEKNINFPNAYAGETRHILDWLYGINFSRALMEAIKNVGSFRILSIGRVQGPALKIIVDKEKEILNFKSVPYWQVIAKIGAQNYTHPKNIFNKEELEKFKNIKEAIAETTLKDEKVSPLHPFDLTTLQRESFRLHGISPSETLKIAQKLYLDGAISYPRTSSQKIPDEIEPKKILKQLEKRFPQTNLAIRKKPIEGIKSDPAHPSIYPTGEFSNLSEREEKIYILIVKRFISTFSPDALIENKKTNLLTEENLNFTASGLKIKETGWTQIYPSIFEEKEIPTLKGKVKIDKIEFLEKETQPPKRYTPTSLITLLEKKNLGTKATRSTIIDTLFNRGYLDGSSIKATPLGIKLIETLEKNSPIIIDENLTRKLEEEIEEIEKESNLEKIKLKEKEIIKKAEKIILDISKDFKANEKNIGNDLLKGLEHLREAERESNTLMPCPACKQGNLRILFNRNLKRSFIGCSNYKGGSGVDGGREKNGCKQTYSLPPNALIKKSEKQCPSCLFPHLIAIRKGKRPWEFCFNPNCEIVIKKRQEWEERKKFEKKNNV